MATSKTPGTKQLSVCQPQGAQAKFSLGTQGMPKSNDHGKNPIKLPLETGDVEPDKHGVANADTAPPAQPITKR